jgi:hypothetical protein
MVSSERFNVPAGVTVLIEVDHEGCLIMLSDIVGPKVHFGVLPQQRPRDHHELRPGRDIFPPLAELVVGEKAQPATASSLPHRKSVPVTKACGNYPPLRLREITVGLDGPLDLKQK